MRKILYDVKADGNTEDRRTEHLNCLTAVSVNPADLTDGNERPESGALGIAAFPADLAALFKDEDAGTFRA